MDRTLEEPAATAQANQSPLTLEFWSFFESVAGPLGDRTVSFRKIFQYLDSRPTPIYIVETGCVRTQGNWAGDGCSTVLFDRYVSERGGHVWSVDIDPVTVALCQQLVGPNVTVCQSDSVKWLHELCPMLMAERRKINLCYLDSFDLDWQNQWPSSLHHLKELAAIRPALDSDTLVVVDDSPAGTHAAASHNQLVVGKGRLVAEYADHLGLQPYFLHYQAAWLGM